MLLLAALKHENPFVIHFMDEACLEECPFESGALVLHWANELESERLIRSGVHINKLLNAYHTTNITKLILES